MRLSPYKDERTSARRARENYFKYLCRHQDIGETEEKIKKGKNAEEEMEMRYCVELFIGFD